MGMDRSATSRQGTLVPVEHGEELTRNKDKLSPDDCVEGFFSLPQTGFFFFFVLVCLCAHPSYGFVLIMWMQGTSGPASLLHRLGRWPWMYKGREKGPRTCLTLKTHSSPSPWPCSDNSTAFGWPQESCFSSTFH